MGFGLLFVPLVGGYLFLTRCHWTRFSVRRQSGHHLLFGSASAGLLLLAAARMLAVLAEEPLGSNVLVVEYWPTLVPFPYVGTIALALDIDFQVVVPVSEVRSARPFDFGTYFQFQEFGQVA